MIDLRKAVVSALLVAAAGQAASKAAPQVDVIATGLNNPRGIASRQWAPYVAKPAAVARELHHDGRASRPATAPVRSPSIRSGRTPRNGL